MIQFGNWKLFILLLINGIIYLNKPMFAQIIPDRTLGSESSIVNPLNEVRDQIEGGAPRGSNLFHSFSEFNIGEGREVYFTNPTGIDNILTRITGENPSQIMGRLGVSGAGNLFLINPNGIIFGSQASLDIQGSFVATTVDRIHLGEGFFSASDPANSSLLAVNPSVLFSNQVAQKAGDIDSQANLSVGQDLTLAAAGNLNIDGNITLEDGGNISLLAYGDINIAPGVSVISTGLLGGNITLDSRGTIFIDGGYQENYSISSESFSPISNTKGGEINITAHSLIIDNEAFILTATLSKANAGDLKIQVTDNITLDRGSVLGSTVDVAEEDFEIAHTLGKSGNLYIEAGSLILKNLSDVDSIVSGTGNSGDIFIKVNDLISLTESSAIRSDLFERGNTGSITIDAPNALISIDGRRIIQDDSQPFVASSMINTSITFSIGQAGYVRINAREISLTNGAKISSLLAGEGNAGSINLKVTDSLIINGGSRLETFVYGRGNAGDITINASSANVSIDGIANLPEGNIFGQVQYVELLSSIISTVDGMAGDGGNINITAKSLSMTNGAQLFTVNFVQGNSGNIILKINDSMILNGGSAIRTDILGQGQAGSIEIDAPNANLFFDGIADIPIYNIEGNTLIQRSPSGLSTNALALEVEGEGRAEDITITAKSLTLTNGAAITAETIRGQGGNITINLSDRLILRYQSLISTTAGTEGSGGNGGNITINSPFIIAVPEENSDISANAFTGQGGQVRLTSEGILGIQFRQEPTPLSDITASSTFGLQGTVEIQTPNIDPINRLIEFSQEIIDAEAFVAQNICSIQANQQTGRSSFTITGRGGLPPNPNDPPIHEGVVDWATRSQEGQKPAVILRDRPQSDRPMIQPIQGWMVTADGTILLTADAPQVAPQPSIFSSPNCL